MKVNGCLQLFLTLLSWSWTTVAFQSVHVKRHGQRTISSSLSATKENANIDDLSQLLTARLPTSVEDQVRQAAESLKRATVDGIHRHTIRLLLPLIGATELDDWPGGARQQMEAACPLMESILQQQQGIDASIDIQKIIIDNSEGVAALMAQCDSAKDDSCTVLLPAAETASQSILKLDEQVGLKRNLILVNPQWRRRSDFGGFFGTDEKTAKYVESFTPTFSLTSLICEGESIRVLRTYPGPWRVFVREEITDGEVDWKEVGKKEFISNKPNDWENRSENKRDGGIFFNYGQPTYQEINEILNSSPDYIPKNPAERAAAAFTFIKDSL